MNSVNPDQTLHFSASELGLQCLNISLQRVTGLKMVK